MHMNIYCSESLNQHHRHNEYNIIVIRQLLCDPAWLIKDGKMQHAMQLLISLYKIPLIIDVNINAANINIDDDLHAS